MFIDRFFPCLKTSPRKIGGGSDSSEFEQADQDQDEQLVEETIIADTS